MLIPKPQKQPPPPPPPPTGNAMLMLHYSKHGECILQEIDAAHRGEHPSDLLLVCEGRQTLRAHKLVLAAASPLIR